MLRFVYCLKYRILIATIMIFRSKETERSGIKYSTSPGSENINRSDFEAIDFC